MHTSQTRQEYVDELLNSSHDRRIYDALRMSISSFHELRDWCLIHTSLKSSRYISIELKIVLFLYIVSRLASSRDATKRFMLSTRTISK
jgi:hypothetical protein